MSVSEEQLVVYDDPIWPFILEERLKKYVEPCRKWWQELDKLNVETTGIFSYTDDPPGLMYRVTKCASKSPIKNVQCFPFVPTAYLQISGVAGGVVKMVERVCAKGMKIEEFTVIEKHNLPSTYNQGQIVALIPSDIYEGTKLMGHYVYLTMNELEALKQGIVLKSVLGKVDNHKNVM